MSHHPSRRDFLAGTALAGAGLLLPERALLARNQAPNDRIRFACIGVGGKGDSDTADAARFGDVVAICDVDENTLAAAAQRYPNAKRYTDFRKLFSEMEREIDAVTVSTPDHTHAPAAATALRLAKHCFCQKPLTHSIYEARRLAELARETRVATQMGNQGTASAELRRNAALIRAGILGKVKEVHVWTNRPIWPQGIDRPAESTPPSHLQWDLWLGPAPVRPYAQGYHTFAWRGWWDFGTGALGDMACHTANMPFMALDLRDPTSVVAEHSGHNRDSYPKWSIITFEFPERSGRAALKMVWYDGGKRPPAELLNGKEPAESGCLVIGEKGSLYSPGDSGNNRELLGDVQPEEVEVTPSPGHFAEWVRAIRGGEPAVSNFPDYAGPLTETILLGNLAVWAGGEMIEWNPRRLRARGAPGDVQQIVRREYREGWSL